jgi:hypothetical protein
MLVDVEFFNARIRKLDGAEDLGPHLVDLVKKKPIIDDSQRLQSNLPEEGGMSRSSAEGEKSAVANGAP